MWKYGFEFEFEWWLPAQAYKGKGEEYRLFWSDRPEFVRMAARYGATIVPFAGIGAEDSVNMLLEPAEIRKLPIIGGLIEQRARNNVPQARRWVPIVFNQVLCCFLLLLLESPDPSQPYRAACSGLAITVLEQGNLFGVSMHLCW